jgi:hypothetical protein
MVFENRQLRRLFEPKREKLNEAEENILLARYSQRE